MTGSGSNDSPDVRMKWTEEWFVDSSVATTSESNNSPSFGSIGLKNRSLETSVATGDGSNDSPTRSWLDGSLTSCSVGPRTLPQHFLSISRLRGLPGLAERDVASKINRDLGGTEGP